ncbi:MAG: mechanosensitive ion channel family protein [Thermoplasmata archaeon]|mgnify:CR=1 FL=1|nr:MAG: mechanosensitive ion channel family protein [Thermoplasmata archaeon]
MAGFEQAIQRFIENLGLSSTISEILTSIILFAIAVLIGLVVYVIFKNYLSRWAEKTETKLDDEILKNIKTPISLFIVLVGAYYSLGYLSFLRPYSNILSGIFIVAETLLVAYAIVKLITVLVNWYAEKRRKLGKELSEHLLFLLKKIVQATVYIFAFLFILYAFNIDLSGVVVGLGVGGIAIALAVQNILGDIFSAFSIYFDRPFEIGDFIVIGEYMGTVKRIGIKSTRIQLLQGEELVISNRELTTAKIRNFKRMEKRRVVFTIGVTYDTPLEKLKKIPEIIREIINPEKLPDVDRLDRVHFKEFGPYSLNFEIVYYLKTRDYMKYMDTQQAINFAIKEAFEKEGIEMAFPTQTIYLSKSS